jgi:hypothetical protein
MSQTHHDRWLSAMELASRMSKISHLLTFCVVVRDGETAYEVHEERFLPGERGIIKAVFRKGKRVDKEDRPYVCHPEQY